MRPSLDHHSLEPLRRMLLIRAFESTLARRRDHGFQLLSTGEEAVAVGLCQALRKGDQLLTGGRSIGLALARGVEPKRLAAELLGKSAGTNRGRGGRGHVADPDAGFFGAHAVVGGNLSIAAGVALARQRDKRGEIVAVVFGDGACGAGALHETLNLAAIWKLPLLFVCNNNQLSVSSSRTQMLAPARLSDLGKGFGLPGETIDGTHVDVVAAAVAEAARGLRENRGPFFLECISHRFLSHSTTARETRSKDELAEIRKHCPIVQETERLVSEGAMESAQGPSLERDAQAIVDEAFTFADASPSPQPAEALNDVD